jgi:hypothetical protein
VRLSAYAAFLLRRSDAEVDHLDQAVVRDEHVVGAHVAVHDGERRSIVVAQFVGVLQPEQRVAQHAQAQRQVELGSELGAFEHRAQRLAFEELHGEEVAIALLAGLDRLHDVRMREARGDRSFRQKHLDEVGALGEIAAQLLQHHQLAEVAQAGGERQMDRAHAALAERREQVIAPEPLAVG